MAACTTSHRSNLNDVEVEGGYLDVQPEDESGSEDESESESD